MNPLYDRLIIFGIVLNGHFKLCSGKHSDMYINKDAIYSKPKLFQDVVNEISVKLACRPSINNVDVITGPAIAGAILAASVALKLGKSFVYPEKWVNAGEPAMKFNRGYDKVLKGKNVIIVEDVVTTGASVEQTLVAVTKCGGLVMDIVTLWTRSPIAQIRSKFDSFCVTYHSLLDKEIVSYNGPDDCPQCKQGIPLTNPKD